MNYLGCKNVGQFNSLYGKCNNCSENDPKFVNPLANDYHLQSGSPAIDSGNSTLIENISDLYYGLYGGGYKERY